MYLCYFDWVSCWQQQHYKDNLNQSHVKLTYMSLNDKNFKMGVKLKLTGYILVALMAILTYFHLECIKERNARSSMFDEFNPEVTDCHNVPLPFRYLLMCYLEF